MSSLESASSVESTVQIDGDWLKERLITLSPPPPGISSYDDHPDVSAAIDCYGVLEAALRDKISDAAFEAYLKVAASQLVEPIIRDAAATDSATAAPPAIQAFPPAVNLAQVALRFTGFFMSAYDGRVLDALTDDAQRRLLDTLRANLEGHAARTKHVIHLSLWCLTVQNFRAAVLEPQAAKLVRAVAAVHAAKLGSKSVTNESLRCYMKLLSQIPAAMDADAAKWGIQAVESLNDDAIRVRQVAVELLERGWQILQPVFQQAPAATEIVALLERDDYSFLRKMRAVVDRDDPVNQPLVFLTTAWMHLIRLLGPTAQLARQSGRALANQLLALVQEPLRSTDPAVLQGALEAWGAFIDAAADPLAMKKQHVALLLKPLKRVAGGDVAKVNVARIHSWWRLASASPPDARDSFRDIVLPLLHFCFSAKPDYQPRVGASILSYAILVHTVRGDSVAAQQLDQPSELRSMSRPVSDATLATSETLNWICGCVRSGLLQKADACVRDYAMTAFQHLAIRVQAGAPPKNTGVSRDDTAVTLLVHLIEMVVEMSHDVQCDRATVLRMLDVCTNAVPQHMLIAAATKFELPGDQQPEDRVTVTPLEALLRATFKTAAVSEGAGSIECVSRIVGRLIECAVISPKPLFYLRGPLQQLVTGGSECVFRSPSLAYQCWLRLGKALAELSEIHEGIDTEPNFETIILALLLPFRYAEQDFSMLTTAQFQEQWLYLLHSFNRRAAILPGGSRFLQVETLALRAASLNMEHISKDAASFRAMCQCTVAILKLITKVGSEVSAINGDSQGHAIIWPLLTMAIRLVRATHTKFAANGWISNAIPGYDTVIVEVAKLLRKFKSILAAKDAEVVLLRPVLEFVQHGYHASAVTSSSSGTRRTKPPRGSAIEQAYTALWDALASKLKMLHKDASDRSMPTLTTIFNATLNHQNILIADVSVALWNSTIGEQPWIHLPDELENAAEIARSKGRAVIVPGRTLPTESTVAVSISPTSAESSMVSSPSHLAIRSRVKKGSFLERDASGPKYLRPSEATSHAKVSTQRSPPKRKAALDEDSAKFVEVAQSPVKTRALTRHQKRARLKQVSSRNELVATYTSLDKQGAAAMDDISGVLHSSPVSRRRYSSSSASDDEPTVSTPTSILKSRRRPATEPISRNTQKKRRVSFDMERNTVHNSAPVVPVLKFETVTPRRSTNSGRAAIVSPPPPARAIAPSPMTSSARSRGEIMVQRYSSPQVDGASVLAVPLHGAPHGGTPIPTSIRAPGVQRCLEPALVPREGNYPRESTAQNAQIYPKLATCSRPIEEILSFFNTGQNRRSTNMVLKAKKLYTVGDFCSLPNKTFQALPITWTATTDDQLERYRGKLSAQPSSVEPSPLAQLRKTPSPTSERRGDVTQMTPLVRKGQRVHATTPPSKSALGGEAEICADNIEKAIATLQRQALNDINSTTWAKVMKARDQMDDMMKQMQMPWSKNAQVDETGSN